MPPNKRLPAATVTDPDDPDLEFDTEQDEPVDESLIPPEVMAEIDARLAAFEADYARSLTEYFGLYSEETDDG